MKTLIAAAQLVTWLSAAAFFSILAVDKMQARHVKNDIVAQLEMQVNYELE